MRKATWAILIWTAIMVVWAISGAAATSGGPTDCGTLSQSTCDAAFGIGAGIGMTFIFFIWFIGFIVLGLVWLMSRPSASVSMYGPEGQHAVLTEREAKKRAKKGWTYQQLQ